MPQSLIIKEQIKKWVTEHNLDVTDEDVNKLLSNILSVLRGVKRDI